MGFFKKTGKKAQKGFRKTIGKVPVVSNIVAGAANLIGGTLAGTAQGLKHGNPFEAIFQANKQGIGGLIKGLRGGGNRRGIDDPTQVDFTDPNIAAQEEARKEADKRKKRAGARVLTSPLSRLVAQSQSTRVLTGQ